MATGILTWASSHEEITAILSPPTAPSPIPSPIQSKTQRVKYFSKNYKVILYDFRAHHKSSIPENPNNLNMESMAKDIDCLMKHLKLEKATFIGHSFGGQVIIKTYDLFPDYFSNIVFINCFIRNPT